MNNFSSEIALGIFNPWQQITPDARNQTGKSLSTVRTDPARPASIAGVHEREPRAQPKLYQKKCRDKAARRLSVGRFQTLVLLVHERPCLVNLDHRGPEAADVLSGELVAVASGTDHEPHDGVPVDPGQPLDRTDGEALQEHVDGSFLLLG